MKRIHVEINEGTSYWGVVVHRSAEKWRAPESREILLSLVVGVDELPKHPGYGDVLSLVACRLLERWPQADGGVVDLGQDQLPLGD